MTDLERSMIAEEGYLTATEYSDSKVASRYLQNIAN